MIIAADEDASFSSPATAAAIACGASSIAVNSCVKDTISAVIAMNGAAIAAIAPIAKPERSQD